MGGQSTENRGGNAESIGRGGEGYRFEGRSGTYLIVFQECGVGIDRTILPLLYFFLGFFIFLTFSPLNLSLSLTLFFFHFFFLFFFFSFLFFSSLSFTLSFFLSFLALLSSSANRKKTISFETQWMNKPSSDGSVVCVVSCSWDRHSLQNTFVISIQTHSPSRARRSNESL